VRFKAAGRVKTRSMPKLSMLTLAVGLLALAGCGSSSSSSTTSSATETTTAASTPATSTPAPAAAAAGAPSAVSLSANPEGQLKYNTTSLSAKAGSVAITFTNSSPEDHNVTIENSSGTVVGHTPTFQGGAKTISVALKAGTYKFFCSVPGHRMAGMEGTLTVQ
jgi:plastocyanin